MVCGVVVCAAVGPSMLGSIITICKRYDELSCSECIVQMYRADEIVFCPIRPFRTQIIGLLAITP